MRLCVIGGKGELPKKVIAKADADGIYCSIIGIAGQNDLDLDSRDFIELDIGKVGAALDFCNHHKISHAIFAGNIQRPSLSSIIPDKIGAKLLWQIGKEKLLGDNSVLKVIIKFFESQGIAIISPSDFLSQNNLSPGNITTNTIPTSDDLENIWIAANALNIISPLDIGQSLIIENKRIIAVEAAEGTDSMIIRSKEYIKERAILVKMPKAGQDIRVDMPTIGQKTIENMHKSNIKGLAIAQNVILLNKDEVIEKAEKAEIFIHIVGRENEYQ
ncbi:MAG: UDP-2,3-diacylglucosamine diphosphatase LpxI [Rickettsiaceae bacterium]|nr:UDP-2,3-diacylglucosamine diphosphatase LpxI [Rickettsiaceae bacterium]